jgi:exodeoxyribonuclease VII large subunit
VRNTEFQRKIYSVSELSAEIRDMLERRFIDVWVEGELSNFKQPSASGHLYFTLKDEREQISAVCFRNTARLLRFRPENGKRFRARGRVSLYDGKCQITVEVLEPAGLGALQLAFEQLKEKLEKEGLFKPERKRQIPAFPRQIGIVTSPKSAALRDILTVLKRRHNAVNVLIFPAEVQGEGASIQVMEGIDYLSRSTDVDVIIVARGGGSMEDLWPFNEERVARAIVRSKKPVISAIGHEVDFTISDFVADLRAPTPSAAAEIVIKSKAEIADRVRQLQGRLESIVKYRVSTLRNFLAAKVGTRGFVVAENRIRRLSQRADDLSVRLEQTGRARAFIKTRLHRVELCEQRLTAAIHQRLKKWHQAFAGIAHTLDALSPLAVLERGYAICLTPEGRVVRSASSVEVGSEVKVQLHEGLLSAKVTNRKP